MPRIKDFRRASNAKPLGREHPTRGMKLTIDRNLHACMVELTARGTEGARVGALYHEAIADWLMTHPVPAKVEVIRRVEYKFLVPEELPALMAKLDRIAYARRMLAGALVEEIVLEFLRRPENYLDAAFYRALPRRYK